MLFQLAGMIAAVAAPVMGSFVTFAPADGYISGDAVAEGTLLPVADTQLCYAEAGGVTATVENQKLDISQPTGVLQTAWVKDELSVGYTDPFVRSVDIRLTSTNDAWVNAALLPGQVATGVDYISVTEFNSLYVFDFLVRNSTATTGRFLIRRHNAAGVSQGYNPQSGIWGANVYSEYDISHELRVCYAYEPTVLSNEFRVTVIDVTATQTLANVCVDMADVANVGGANEVRMIAGDSFASSIGQGNFTLDNITSQAGAERVGIGGGGHQHVLVVDSSDTIWLGTWVAGLMFSTNSGVSWSDCEGLPVRCVQGIAVSDDYPELVYVATEDGVYKSENNGLTWDAAGLQGEFCSAVTLTKTSQGDKVVLAGVGDTLHGNLGDGNCYRSINNGAFSAQTIGMSDTSKPIYSIVTHPDAETFFVSTGDGVYKTANGGSSWVDLTDNLPHSRCRRMYHKPGAYTDLVVVLAGDGSSGGGVYRRKLGESDWTNYSGDLPAGDLFYDVVSVSSVYCETLYLTRVSGDGGVFCTTNSGQDWAEIFTANCQDRGWNTWTKQKLYALAEDGSGRLYVGGSGVGYNSTNGGFVWNQCYSDKVSSSARIFPVKDPDGNGYAIAADSWKSRGELVNTYVRHVTSVGSNLYYSLADRVLMVSKDNGQSFRKTGFYINNQGAGDMFFVKADPFDPEILYGAPAVGYSSSGGASALFISTNSAASWSLLAGTTNAMGGLPGDKDLWGLDFYTDDGVDQLEMYAAVITRGVYTSPDNGIYWALAGLSGKNVISVAVNPKNRDHILVAATGGSSNDYGLWRGDRSGGTWSFSHTLNSAKGWKVIAKDYRTYFAACVQVNSSMTGGLFRSTNWGTSWTDITPPDSLDAGEGIKAVTYDQGSKRLYTATFNQVWMSPDDGDSWVDLQFFTAFGSAIVTALHIQQLGDRQYLYAGTTEGVFRKELVPYQ